MTTNTVRADEVVGHPKRWQILAVVLSMECMDLLDGSMTNVAGPSISRDLHTSSEGLQWILSGYSLAVAIGLILGGRLGDIYGRRRMFVIGVGGFTAASLLCAIAPDTGVLIACRLLQGALGASVLPQGFGIIREVFPLEDRTKAFGFFGPVIGMAAVLGPVLGGVLVDADLFGTHWRLIFLINLPIGATAFSFALSLLPRTLPERKPTVDIVGAAIVLVSSFLLIYPLIEGRDHNWAAWTWISMAAGVVGFAIFAREQFATARHGRDPLVVPTLFTKSSFVVGILVFVVFFGALTGLILCFSLFLQFGSGFSAMKTGVAMIAFSVGLAVGAGISGGVLAARIGRHAIHLGCAVMTVGCAVLWIVIDHVGTTVHPWQLIGPELLIGLGVGFVVAPLFGLVLNAVTDEEVGSGSGVVNAVQQLGASLGVAVLGTVFIQTTTHHGFSSGFERGILVTLVAIGATAVLALFLPMDVRMDLEG